MRTLVMAVTQLGPLSPDVIEFIEELRLNQVYPSQSSEMRWARDYDNGDGDIRPYRRTGNAFATRLRGQDLIYLALYRVAYPKASHAEINAFLYKMNFGNPFFSFYSHSQISLAEKRIGLSWKASSTTAYQAFLPVNINKRWAYWNLAYPMGMGGICRQNIIDLDECGVFLETADRPHGKAYVGVHVRDFGPYVKGEKWNLQMAICGEDGGPAEPARRWASTWMEGGTTIERMVDFIQMILNDIGHATADNFYVFTMDNLSSHKNMTVVALIHLHGHGVIYHAPYWAVDAPIEYVFNTLQGLLRNRLHSIHSPNDLRAAIYQSIQTMVNFGGYFTNVGFNLN